MTEMPSLQKLLNEPFALILGAGASMGYGFPSWYKLKQEMISRLADESDQVANIFGPKMAQEFLHKIRTMKSDETIDTVAERLDGDGFTLFQMLTSSIILKCEEKSKAVEHGWIEVFIDKIANLFEHEMKSERDPLIIFTNLNVITLNYDRLFEYKFSSKIEAAITKRLPRERQFKQLGYDSTLAKIGNVIHPHGAIGSFNEGFHRISCSTYLNKESGLGMNYGDHESLMNGFTNWKRVPYICPVDDITQAKDNRSYDEANSILKNVSTAFCIGLSEIGITSSNLELDSIKTIYSSDKAKVSDNFVPLAKRALPLFEELKVKP